MNRLKKVQSYDHSNHQGTAWDQYTADDRYQMQLTYDMNGNILTLKRNGNDAGNLQMDDFNYKYYSLSGTTQQDIQLTGFNGTNTSIATNRLSLLEEDINLAPNYNADVDGLSGTGNVIYSYDELGNLTQDLSEEIEEIKWNAYGKVVEVLRTSTCQDKPDLVYVYDAFGQRIKKTVKQRTGGQLSHEKDWQETYYLRNAQGNVMAMYSHNSSYNSTDNSVSESFRITEWDLYSSSRLGIRSADKATDVLILAARNYTWTSNTVSNEYILPTTNITYKKYRVLGLKTFELTNHLGNVISTVSDRKLMIEDQQNTGFVHHYVPEILSIGEQYAFGMSMPGRTFSVEDYRYGFNGKENQDELLGEDNSQDFGARMYDARIGRWWGLDQMRASFPSISPYVGLADNPILFVDPDGKANTIYIAFTKYGYEQFFGNGALSVLPLQVMMKELENALNSILGDGNVIQVKFLPEEILSPDGLDPSDAIIVLGSVSELLNTAENYFGYIPGDFIGWKGSDDNNPEKTWLDFSMVDISEHGIGDVADQMNFSGIKNSIVYFMLHGDLHTTGKGHTNENTHDDPGNHGGWGREEPKTKLMEEGNLVKEYLLKNNLKLVDITNDKNNTYFRDKLNAKFNAKKPTDNYSFNLSKSLWKLPQRTEVKTPLKKSNPVTKPRAKPNSKPKNDHNTKPKNKTPHRPKF